jgi:hypothetical protein
MYNGLWAVNCVLWFSTIHRTQNLSPSTLIYFPPVTALIKAALSPKSEIKNPPKPETTAMTTPAASMASNVFPIADQVFSSSKTAYMPKSYRPY